jgi:hypothetical protein
LLHLPICTFDADVTMAFNSWDKLAKAQRDYPKLKFAALFVDKNLKKQPNNPYLLVSVEWGSLNGDILM